MKTQTLRNLGRNLPFLIMGICTWQAVFFYTRPGTHQEPLAVFFALVAVGMMVVIGLTEVVPSLRRLTGHDTGDNRIDDQRWKRQIANGYLSLLATQAAAAIALIPLHLAGQTLTLLVLSGLLVFSKMAQVAFGAFR